MKEDITKTEESGIALIAVLCMILTASVLVASGVIVSQYAALETATFCSYSRSFYTAESAGNLAKWMIMLDKKQYPDRALGAQAAATRGRWMADTLPHRLKINGFNAVVTVEDAACGINLSNTPPSQDLRNTMQKFFINSSGREGFTAFCDQMDLYCDPNSLVRSGGTVNQEYLQRKLFNMPRRAAMQFREEIYYLPGAAKRYPPDAIGRLRAFNVIPKGNMRRIYSRPNLFSAPINMIKERCQLTSSECTQVQNALRLWRINHIPLKTSIEGTLMSKLLGQFSDRESGFFSIVVQVSSKNSPGCTLNFTFCPDSLRPPFIEYYNYVFY